VKILPITLAALALLAPATASAKTTVPPDIQPPAGHKQFFEAHAIGVQIYACNGTAWTLSGPRANLYRGRSFVASHFAGPTWMHRDGSYVVGTLAKPFPVEGTIPWLLLSATATGAGPYGDKFAEVSYIQRVNTTGGVAPALPCTAGKVAEVPYTADYRFFKAAKQRA
jgi:hypothetical protein